MHIGRFCDHTVPFIAFRARAQWQGLPYGEATFEKAEDIEKAGGAAHVTEFQVSLNSAERALLVHRFG